MRFALCRRQSSEREKEVLYQHDRATPMTPIPATRSRPSTFRNAYTDAPDLHSNLLLASLQLLFWLFFHPSAWRNYITRIDPTLRPDFWLLELTWTQWRNPRLRHLLVASYLLWPLIAGGAVGLVGWLIGKSLQDITVSVAAGIAFIMIVGMTIGMAIGLAVGVTIFIAFNTAGSFALGMAAGLAGYMATQTATRPSVYPFARQIGGSLIGIIIGGLMVIVAGGLAISVALHLAIGLAFGIAFGLRTGNWRRSLLGIITVSLVSIVATSKSGTIADGVVAGGLMASLFALPFVIAERIGGVWAGAVAGTVGVAGFWIAVSINQDPQQAFWSVALGLLGMVAGLTLTFWRPIPTYLIATAWNTILYWADLQRSHGQAARLRYHAAFWDEQQFLPWIGLDSHIVMVTERNTAEGQAAIAYLTTHQQRWAAQAAQIELDIHKLGRCEEVEQIRHAYPTLIIGELQGQASSLLRIFGRISRDVDAALQQESNYNQRLALSLVEDRLDNLTRELDRSSESYANRFRPIAVQWWQAVDDYIYHLTEIIEQRQELDSPYVIGVPLNEQQEIFVGRTDIGSRIEQLLLDKRRPPLLLYGQRRMGKTSLLNNLGRLLPSTVVPLYVDLQGAPASASDYAGLLYTVARIMIDAAQRQRNLPLPLLSRAQVSKDPFTSFDEWLDQVERRLDERTALLILDEFEALDSAIEKGRFDEEDILGMLRHLIQHRPRFKVLLAGSHTLEEYHRWSSYLINVQVVQVSYLKADEARQLVERPVKDFALRYETAASQRVLDLTHCHPFLVQLLCAEIVALKNEQDPSVRRFATLADVAAAVPEALKSGSFFFADIERNQVDDAGRSVLRCMAGQGEGKVTARTLLAQVCPMDLEATLKHLLQRELIEPVGDGYRFQVELIRRWFMQA